ncbi:MAG: pentapeptide repeat-containing protein [Rhodospirillales bacterium]|nr:pentapeptide repeat-containing protein [Rhodospirillales bacterium]
MTGFRNLWGKFQGWGWLLVLLAIPAALYGLWDWAHEKDPSNSETLRNLALVLAAVIGLPLAVWRSVVAHRQAETANEKAEAAHRQAETANEQVEAAHRQAEIANEQAKIAHRQAETANKKAETANEKADIASRQADTSDDDDNDERGLRNERYQKGADMLGSATLATRLGGIHALERLAQDHPEDYHVQIMQLLCAFARHPTEPAAAKAVGHAGDATDWKHADQGCRTDVEAAARAVSECRKRLSNEDGLAGIEASWEPDLSGADLSDADLSGADLSDADLSGADLSDADLSGADLSDADLSDADLSGADLSGADLIGANLISADLIGANLYKANYKANLPGTGLTEEMPPQRLLPPEGLVWPFEEGEDGKWRRKP